jgi:hypothetical protein
MKTLIAKQLFSLPFAAATTIADFKGLVGSALGVMTVLSFFFAVISFIVAVISRGRNPEMSKWAFATSFLLGIAVPAVSLMFAAAGQGSAAVDPKF